MSMKSRFRKLKNLVSAPWLVYLFITILAITLIVIGYNTEDSRAREICKNLGFGIVGSLCVAWLIDIATTNAKQLKDSMDMQELLSPYRKAFLDMRDSVIEIAEKRFGADGIQRTFDEWIQYAICEKKEGESIDEYWENTYLFFHSAEEIKDITGMLYNKLLLHMENTSIDRDYRDHIRHMHFVAASIFRDWEQENYENAIRTVKKALIPSFLKYNQDYENYFNSPYSVSRWEDENE